MQQHFNHQLLAQIFEMAKNSRPDMLQNMNVYIFPSELLGVGFDMSTASVSSLVANKRITHHTSNMFVLNLPPLDFDKFLPFYRAKGFKVEMAMLDQQGKQALVPIESPQSVTITSLILKKDIYALLVEATVFILFYSQLC